MQFPNLTMEMNYYYDVGEGNKSLEKITIDIVHLFYRKFCGQRHMIKTFFEFFFESNLVSNILFVCVSKNQGRVQSIKTLQK